MFPKHFCMFNLRRGHLEAGQCSSTQLPDVVVVSSCEPQKVSSIFTSFDSHKASAVRSIGFGGLLELPQVGSLSDDLSLWLYERYDNDSRSLKLDGGAELPIRPVDVPLIFGIPFEGQSIQYATSQSTEIVTAFTRLLCYESSSPSLTLSFLEDILKKDYGPSWSEAENSAFKIAAVLYSVSYLLAPGPHHDFPASLISNFLPDLNLGNMNWAELVLWTLSRACTFARSQKDHGNKNIILFGCSLLLQV